MHTHTRTHILHLRTPHYYIIHPIAYTRGFPYPPLRDSALSGSRLCVGVGGGYSGFSSKTSIATGSLHTTFEEQLSLLLVVPTHDCWSTHPEGEPVVIEHAVAPTGRQGNGPTRQYDLWNHLSRSWHDLKLRHTGRGRTLSWHTTHTCCGFENTHPQATLRGGGVGASDAQT